MSARSEVEQLSRKQASSSGLKILDTIDVLAEAGPLTLSELCKRLARPMPSVHRLLRTLELRNYVENVDGRYRLTLRLFEIGSAVVSNIDVVAEARPICERLRDEVEETVNMSIRSGTSAVYVMKLESSRSLRLVSQLGMHVPLYCTAMGKVLLAFDEPDEAQRVVEAIAFEPRTKRTIESRTTLEEAIQSVKRIGYAVDNQEFEDGLVCVAAPVFGRSGHIVAAISVTGPAARLPQRGWPAVGRTVTAAAASISARLGFRTSGMAPIAEATSDHSGLA